MAAQVDGQAGPKFGLGDLDVVVGDALAVPLFHDLRPAFERHLFQPGDVEPIVRHALLGLVGKRERLIWRQRHQRGQFRTRQFQVLAPCRQQADGIEQRALIGQGLLARQQALFVRFLRGLQTLADLVQQCVDLADQALRAKRAPVGITDILQHVLHDLATALLGHQHLIGLLLGAFVGHQEIQRAPRQVEIGQAVVALF